MEPQQANWTCSACSLDWVMRATELEPGYNRVRAINEIGYPEQINPTYGLTNVDGPGQALMDVYSSYDIPNRQGWLSFDQTYELAQSHTGQLSGSAWYHWVAIRGVQGSNLWIANSAPGYQGVYDVLSRYDFDRLGPFSVVILE